MVASGGCMRGHRYGKKRIHEAMKFRDGFCKTSAWYEDLHRDFFVNRRKMEKEC